MRPLNDLIKDYLSHCRCTRSNHKKATPAGRMAKQGLNAVLIILSSAR